MLIKHLKKLNLNSSTFKAFSTAAKKPNDGSISLKFHEMYVKELERIQKNSTELIEAKYKVDNTKTPTEAYVHPYHSTKFPVYWSTKNLFQFLHEAIGTEPVSPHYESFVRSRRMLFSIVMAGGLYAIQLIESLNLNSFYGQHAVYELYTLVGFSIGLLEIRYIAQKLPAPRLTWFYNAFIDHEMEQFWLNWQDKIEESSRQFLAFTKEQIDYYLIHKEYIYIKKRSLCNYLESQKKNLEKHFFERTAEMLKTIEAMENSNIKNTITKITEEAMEAVMKVVESDEGRKSLHHASFKSALSGLKTGKMTYEGDVLLPLFLSEIRKRLEPLSKLTKEEEDKLFALGPEQRKMLIENDHRAKIQYLANPPEVTSGTVKNTEAYKNILSRMKRRIESNFKF